MKKQILLFALSALFISCCDETIDDSIVDNIINPPDDSALLWKPGSDLGNPLKPYSETNSNLVSATVHKMLEYNGELYVGGDFQVIGGQIIPYLAKWDGTNWSTVAQINGPVEDMIVFQDKLYIQVNEIESPQSLYHYNKIYSWDSNSLNEVQANIDGVVAPTYAISPFEGGIARSEQWTVHDAKLFVFAKVGQFNWWGGNWYDGTDFALLWWDGGQFWNFDADFSMYHGVLKSYQGQLYCTKKLHGNDEEFGLFRFNGDFDNSQQSQGWENVTGNVINPPKIYTLQEYDNKLIAGGNFETIGGIQASNIAAFDGSSWSTFGNWPYETYELHLFNNKLYASFFFGNFNGLDAERVASFNGSTWDSLLYNLSEFDTPSDGNKNTLQFYNNHLYFGGNNTVYGTNNFIKLEQ